jgi:hypothetical protein
MFHRGNRKSCGDVHCATNRYCAVGENATGTECGSSGIFLFDLLQGVPLFWHDFILRQKVQRLA